MCLGTVQEADALVPNCLTSACKRSCQEKAFNSIFTFIAWEVCPGRDE
jgi:hypothetical protein